MFKKIVVSIIIFFGVITLAQSETSWIKKKDKSKKIEKVKKEENMQTHKSALVFLKMNTAGLINSEMQNMLNP